MAHPDLGAQAEDVADVVSSLGITEGEGPIRLEAWNKADLLGGADRQARVAEAGRRNGGVARSALCGWGGGLAARLRGARWAAPPIRRELALPPAGTPQGLSAAAPPAAGSTPQGFCAAPLGCPTALFCSIS